MTKIREELHRRLPRLTMSLVMGVIFWVISIVVPPTVSEIIVPGVNVNAGFLLRIMTITITAIFLIRALSDALFLGDILTAIAVRRLGIKGERSPRRAARDFMYIIIIMLIATAILPAVSWFGGDISYWITTITIYVALGIIVLLIYDIGRVLYGIVEKRAESLADRLSKIAEENGG